MVTGTFWAPSMINHCDLCGHGALKPVYEPERSTRGLKVHLCNHCGLLQSLPRTDRAAHAPMADSSGADRGNVRYGKGFRTAAAMASIARHADLSDDITVLDVGSNRGSFARALLNAAPSAILVALEPDERIAALCAGLERTQLAVSRIEDAALESGRFDIIHSCHTLEHLAEPKRILGDHWRCLRNGGLLVLDVPNTALLENHDIVEEWFSDKHLYHFSVATLSAMVKGAGFEIIDQPNPGNRENLLIVARKASRTNAMSTHDEREVKAAEALIGAYRTTRAQNISAQRAA